YDPSGAGTWTLVATDTAAGTSANQRYRVRIRYTRHTVRVHRRAVVGAGSQAWVTLFASTNLVDLLPGPLDNTAVRLVTQSNVDASFDNIKVESSSNLDEFLHLAPNSPCIDVGFTELID